MTNERNQVQRYRFKMEIWMFIELIDCETILDIWDSGYIRRHTRSDAYLCDFRYDTRVIVEITQRQQKGNKWISLISEREHKLTMFFYLHLCTKIQTFDGIYRCQELRIFPHKVLMSHPRSAGIKLSDLCHWPLGVNYHIVGRIPHRSPIVLDNGGEMDALCTQRKSSIRKLLSITGT